MWRRAMGKCAKTRGGRSKGAIGTLAAAVSSLRVSGQTLCKFSDRTERGQKECISVWHRVAQCLAPGEVAAMFSIFMGQAKPGGGRKCDVHESAQTIASRHDIVP